MRYLEHVPGTKDYTGAEAELLLHIADTCASIFELYGYERIILPILERSDIFLQRSGEEIRSRMYILRDPRGKEICLRPEITISAARAFLERMSSRRLPVRLSYQGDVFRYDKIKEGRYRQFMQAGIECIGSENHIAADVETVTLALEVINKLGISGFELLLGDLGLAAEFINSLPAPSGVRSHLLQNFWRRDAFQHLLKRFTELGPQGKLTNDSGGLELAEMLSSLGEKTSHVLVRQILSLFVEKEIGQRDLDEIAERFLHRFIRGENSYLPQESLQAIQDYLSISGEPDAVLHQVEKLMQNIGVSPGQALENIYSRVELLKKVGTLPGCVQLDLGFRRGIEYYTGFIFEIHCPELGSVSQVCGGGRYDGLLSALGAHRPIPAVGFALGIDRLNLALGSSPTFLKDGSSTPVDAVLATVGQVPEELAWQIAQICREGGWRVRLEIDHRRLGTILGHASEDEIPFVIIAGEDETRDRNVRIRDMLRHNEQLIPIDTLKRYVQVSVETKKNKDTNVHPYGAPLNEAVRD